MHQHELTWGDIADSIRLEEVLNALGISTTQQIRGEYWDSCPLPSHPGADRSPSFSINEEKLLFNCFTCGDGGLLPKLVQLMENVSWDEALEWLVPYSDGLPTEEDGFLSQIRRLLGGAESPSAASEAPSLPFFLPKVIDSLPEAPVEACAKWGLDAETISLYRIKLDPERTKEKRGKTFVGPCLVIPHYVDGNVVGYMERWPDERPKWLPKYTNSEGFPKRHTLFNLDRVRNANEPVLVVEAAMTAAKLDQLGYPAVGTFGASITDLQYEILRTFTQGLILCRDNDPRFLNANGVWVDGAGTKNLRTSVKMLDKYIPLFVIDPPPGEKQDLADVPGEVVDALYAKRRPAFLAVPAT